MEELTRELEQWAARGLLRSLEDAPRIGASGLVDFVSNDYLGLAGDPAVIAAARAALDDAGAGGRGSRLLGGGSAHHQAAEDACAAWLGAASALLFPSGFQANLGVVQTLVGPADAVFSDARNHASLIDACRQSRARVFVHRHLDLDELEAQLQRSSHARRRLVLTEGIFSMDGDAPDLVALAALCERQDAWLVVDEAHSVGVLGPSGRGAVAAAGIQSSPSLVARIVTGGKSLGGSGAFVCGSEALRKLLVNRARSFVFTTAPSAATAAGLTAAIDRARQMDAERQKLRSLAERTAAHFDLPRPAGAIVPVRLGAPERAVAVAAELQSQGVDVRAVRPPTVPDGASGLRVVVHAHNTDAELDALLDALPQPQNVATAATALRPGTPWFVIGTDTGIGKTVISALLLRAARRLGPATYWKPVQTGDDSDTGTVATLAEATDLRSPSIELPLPASPHEAAAAAGVTVAMDQLGRDFDDVLATHPGERVVVELAGGLLVPYRIDPGPHGREHAVTQADWLAQLRPNMVLVARSGLGTLNHTLLTLEALRARHLEPRALFLVGETHPPNCDTLTRIGGVPAVFEVPEFAELSPAVIDAWLDENDLSEVWA